MRKTTLLLTGLFVALPAFAQQPVPPPPRPVDAVPAPLPISQPLPPPPPAAAAAPDAGPSLSDTVRFIEDKLNAQGKMTWRLTREHNGKTKKAREYGEENNRFSVDAGSWLLRFDKVTYEGSQILTSDALSVSFKEVDTLEVMTLEDEANRAAAADGHPDDKVIIPAPAPFALVITLKNHQRVHFLFSDEQLANRVAKAMIHAIDLCGGPAGKDPF